MDGSTSLVADRATGDHHRIRILVGWDGSDDGLAVVRFATEIAVRLDAQVDVVHVHDLSDMPEDPDGVDWDEQVQAHLDLLTHRIENELAGLRNGWTYHVARGEAPARLLLRLADDLHAYMLILGSPHAGIFAIIAEVLGHHVARGILARNHTLPMLFVPVDRRGHRRAPA
ncbi:universal stress protein [Tsukamurella soli]|uniref:Universal stress protein n=1 Tax=Tsukamurella soli TaxID=644556 RepID=A0ABP8JLE2_9ACTN